MLKVLDNEGEKVVLITDVDQMSTEDFHNKMTEWMTESYGDEGQALDDALCEIPFLGYTDVDKSFYFEDSNGEIDEELTFDEWMNELAEWALSATSDDDDEELI